MGREIKKRRVFQLTSSDLILHLKNGKKLSQIGPGCIGVFPKTTKICTGNPSQPLILIFIPEIAIKTSLNTSRNDNKISQIQIMAILMVNRANSTTKKDQNNKFYYLHYIKGLENLFWYLDIDFKP